MFKSHNIFFFKKQQKSLLWFFLSCIKTTVTTRESFLCQQAENNQYFQMAITCGLVCFFLLCVISKQKTFF